MSDVTPTVTERQREVQPGRPPAAGRPVEEPWRGEPVALRGTPERTAAPAPVVSRTTTVTTSPADRLVQTVWVLGAITETILGLHVLFHALNANRGTAVVRFIDYITAPLMAPFSGIVGDQRLGNGGMLDVSALITMAVYLVATFIVARIARILSAPRTAVPA